MSDLPPCGLYRTTRPTAGVPEGRLVYFHDHGDPGPGLYTPHEWVGNRARFHERGHTLTESDDATSLEPLSAEGLYRVVSEFHCCDNRCRLFEPESLVQLGYDAAATPILFTPELDGDVLRLPEQGIKIDRQRIANLSQLRVADASAIDDSEHERLLH